MGLLIIKIGEFAIAQIPLRHGWIYSLGQPGQNSDEVKLPSQGIMGFLPHMEKSLVPTLRGRPVSARLAWRYPCISSPLDAVVSMLQLLATTNVVMMHHVLRPGAKVPHEPNHHRHHAFVTSDTLCRELCNSQSILAPRELSSNPVPNDVMLCAAMAQFVNSDTHGCNVNTATNLTTSSLSFPFITTWSYTRHNRRLI